MTLNLHCFQNGFIKVRSCVSDIQALSKYQKAMLITTVVVTAISLLTFAFLGRLNVLQNLSSLAQNGMFCAAAFVATSFLITFAIYKCRNAHNPFPNNRCIIGDFTDSRNKDFRKIKAFTERLIAGADHAIQNKQAAQYLFRILDSPKDYLVAVDHPFEGTNLWLFPFLNECACCNSGNFNRFLNERRLEIEDKMVLNVTARFPSHETEGIRYLSLGAGGLLQDFIIVGKLIRAAYKKIDVVLVDLKLEKDHKKIEQFEFLKSVASELGITISISYHQSPSVVDGEFHIISAIDFDDFLTSGFSDVISAHKRIAIGGCYYLAFDSYDFIFDHRGLIEKKIHKKRSEKIDQFLESISSASFDHKQVNITFMHEGWLIFQWVYCLPALFKDKNIEKAIVTMPAPKTINARYEFILNDAMDNESIKKLLELLFPSIKFEINFYSTVEELNQTAQAQDVLVWIRNSKSETQNEQKSFWIKEYQPNATQYFLDSSFI